MPCCCMLYTINFQYELTKGHAIPIYYANIVAIDAVK